MVLMMTIRIGSIRNFGHNSMIKKLQLLIGIVMTGYAVWFNLNLYHLEPTATTDPNDNNFQFALVDRANTVWDFAHDTCSKEFFLAYPICHLSYMSDHWVPNWAQGYNVPYYYSHTPQIAIVASYRFLNFIHAINGMSLFTFYHWVIYFLLCLFPLPLFIALRVIGLSWFMAGVGAVFGTHLSTDGLYGLDPSSFLWRGYGLSSQLYAMIFFPLSLAFSWKFMNESSAVSLQLSAFHDLLKNKTFWLAVLFTVATVSGHLGIGMMALLSVGIFALARPLSKLVAQESIRDIKEDGIESFIRLALLGGTVILFLAYWIIPTMTGNNYHNISYWDPVWKFNSYGWKETVIRLTNGDLLDFGRFPVLTLLTFIGAFLAPFLLFKKTSAVSSQQSTNNVPTSNFQHPTSLSYFAFSLLFIFWVMMYFGRTTWGGLIDLIPGMTEFHLSRFIVGLHITAMFLAAIGFSGIVNAVAKTFQSLLATNAKQKASDVPWWAHIALGVVLLSIIAPPVYNQTTKYNELNDKLIVQANGNAAKIQTDVDEMMKELKSLPPSRVYLGRGGSWGKNFKIAETEMFMYASNFGIPTVCWLPETWSPNSDIEQYFSENQKNDYDLMNLHWVMAPPTEKPQPFYKEIKRNPSWVLYEVPTSGYFEVGTRNMAVITKKTDYVNIVRLWLQSSIPSTKLFPQIAFKKSEIYTPGDMPIIQMVDEANYLTAQGKRQNIWGINPLYGGDAPKAQLVGPESVDRDMVFKTTVKVEQGCKNCMIILKQSYHPSWIATVDGRQVKPITVFPFYIGIPLETSGVHEIVVSYKPSSFKVIMLTASVAAALILIGYFLYPWIPENIKEKFRK
jgi:hypothetical protein